MSAVSAVSGPGVEAAPSAGRTGRRRRTGPVVLVGALLVLVAVAVTVVLGGDVRHEGRLDPADPGPDGARAVARVLADQGVDVTVARDADALERARPDVRTTVLVTSSDRLGRSTARRLLAARQGALLVVAEPDAGTLEALGVDTSSASVRLHGPRPARCPEHAGLELAVDEGTAYGDGTGCFPTGSGALLAEPRPGLVLLGAAETLTNEQVLRADDAALALRLLGQRDRLVWYVPSLDDLVADDSVGLSSLLPPWLGPALLVLAFAAVGLVAWRARRLGRLATEPLPVVVRAAETAESRGRLYRRAGDRGHAAEVLRAASRRRAADRLGLGARPDPELLLDRLAGATGRDRADLSRLLGRSGPTPTTDRELVALADRLADLDREVSHL